MRRPSRPSLACSFAVAALLSAPAAALAADWPQFQADEARTGAAEGPAPPYGVAWSTPVAPAGPEDRFGLSPPIVADGVVVSLGPESVEAFDVVTGEPAWSLERELGPPVPPALATGADPQVLLFTEGWGDGPDLSSASATPSQTATPSPTAVPSPTSEVFAGPSRLVAVTWPDGERRWKVDLPEVSRSGVTVADDLALVGTNDGSVTAVEIATGDVAWTAEAGGNVEQAIAVADGIAVVSVRGGEQTPASVVGLDLDDGSEAWRYEPEAPTLVASAAALADGAAFVGTSDGTVHAVGLADGTLRWSARVNGFAPWSPPATSDGRVFVVTTTGQAYAFDAATGTREWDHARNVGVFPAAPVVAGEVMVVGTVEGQLVAFEVDGGDAVWHLDLGEGAVHAIAATGEELVVVRGGPDAGVAALTHDDAGTTVRERSPTVPEPVRIVGYWALAAVPIGVVAVLLGRMLSARMGPPDLGGPEDEDADGESEVEDG